MKFHVDINEWHVSIDTYSISGAAVCFSQIFFSEVLNLNKFLRIFFFFLRILGDSLQNYNKNEKKKNNNNNKKNSSKIFSRECK